MERGKFSLPRSIPVSLRIKLSKIVENDPQSILLNCVKELSPDILIL